MSRRTPRLSVHYGWIIVLAGYLVLFACLGLARFAYGMLLPGMRADLGFGYDRMGLISTGNFVGYLASVALVPRLLRRFRPRLTITAGLVLIAGSMLAIGTGHGFPAILGLYGLAGFGSGLANIPAMVLVSHWFRRSHRGRAAGLMIAGNGSAIILSGFLVPFLNRMFGASGWRAGWLVLGGLVALIALLAAWLLRNTPAELGLEPLGTAEAAGGTALAGERAGGGLLVLKLGMVYLIFGATYMVYGTFIVSSMVEEYGLDEATAGFYWSWVGLLSIASGILFGMLSDRIGRRGGLAAVFAVQCGAYLLAASGLGVPALLLSILLYGLAAFAIPTIMAAAVGDYFGTQQAARVFSLVTFFFAAGQTFGPGGAGVLADRLGSFAPAYLAAAGLTGLAVLLCRLLPAVRQPAG